MKLDIQLFADGKVVIKTELDTSGFEDGLDDMENSSMLSQFISVIKEKLSNVGSAMSDAIKKAGKGIKGLGKAIKDVGKIALQTIAKFALGAIKLGAALIAALPIVALLGLGFVSAMQAIKKIGEENKTLKNDIKYIWFSIKTALQPAIDAIANGLVKIINFLIQMIKYAMAFANALAGRNLFDKATPKAFAKAMKDAEKSSKKTAGHAKEIKKQLAGFDEMNVLQDNSAGGGGGGAATDYMPSFDASSLDIELPSWMKWIVDNKQFIIDGLLGIAAGFGAIKLGLTALQGVGIGLITFGLTELIRDITNPETDGLEKAFKILGDIAIILGGILMFFNPLYGIVVALIGFVLKYFPEISNWVSNLEDKIANWLIHAGTFVKEFWKLVVEKFEKFKENWKSGWNTLKQWTKSLFKGIGNALISVLNGMIDAINVLLIPLRTIIWGFGKIAGKNWKLSEVKIGHIKPLAKGGIINQPGRGVAIGGERGSEGVIPLTDSQQMELLGEAIGKYITINANITNTMNGRIISRELQKINNENSFAGNR